MGIKESLQKLKEQEELYERMDLKKEVSKILAKKSITIKKCVVCHDPAEYSIKGTNEFYCKECAIDSFGSTKYVKKITNKERKKFKKALIIIDLENEWIDKKSEYYIGDISKDIRKINELIDFYRDSHKIIFIKHVELEGKNFRGENAELISTIHYEDDIIITKNKISAFYKTDLEKELKGIKEVVVCGILTNLCVRKFVEDAYDREYNIIVVKDCCVAMNKKIQLFTISDLKTTREEIIFVNLKDVIV